MTAPAFTSAADGRGFAWFARWVELGGEFDTSGGGFAVVPPAPDRAIDGEIAAMVGEVRSSSLLAHAVARRLADYRRWEAATDGGRTYPDGTVRP